MRMRQYIAYGVKALVVACLIARGALGQRATPAHAEGAGEQAGTKPAMNAHIASGQAMLQARDFREAMGQFEAVLAINASDARARKGEVKAATAWAVQEEHLGHVDQTMLILERAIRQLPDEPELLVSFGLEAVALGQFPIADQALHAAERLRPGDPNTVYALARLEIEQQHMPDAERDLKAYLKLRPGDASAYFGLGHVYAMEQRIEEARSAFQKSIELQPAQTASYYQIGELDLQAHRDDEAGVVFEKVLARDPQHAGALTGMGELALHRKAYAQAEHFLAEAERSDPTYQPPHYFRGLALARLGRRDEAEQELRRGDSRPHATAPGDAAGATSAQETEPNRKPQP